MRWLKRATDSSAPKAFAIVRRQNLSTFQPFNLSTVQPLNLSTFQPPTGFAWLRMASRSWRKSMGFVR